MSCNHGYKCPQVCPCEMGCICQLTLMDGGTGMCHSAAVASRRAAIEARDPDDPFAFMNDVMSDFSYVKWAEDNKDPQVDLNYGKLDDKQSLMARRFWDLHGSIHGQYTGAIDGRYGWRIIGTSVGVITITYCSACNEELDVTDYKSW